MQDRHRSGIYFALLTCFFWCVIPLIVKSAVATISVNLLVWGRFVVAGLLFLVVSFVRYGRKLSIDRATFIAGLVAGGFLAINSYCYTSGLALTGAANAQVLVQMNIPFSLLVGISFFHERPTRWHYFGFLVAGIGFTFFYYAKSQGEARPDTLVEGSIYILIAAVTLTAYAATQRAFVGRAHSEVLNVLVFLIGSAYLAPAVDYSELLALNFEQSMYIVGLGTMLLLGYGCFAEAVRRAPLTQASVIIALNPLLTLLLMYVLAVFGLWASAVEVLSPEGYVGAVVGVVGVVMISSKRVPIVYKNA